MAITIVVWKRRLRSAMTEAETKRARLYGPLTPPPPPRSAREVTGPNTHGLASVPKRGEPGHAQAHVPNAGGEHAHSVSSAHGPPRLPVSTAHQPAHSHPPAEEEEAIQRVVVLCCVLLRC